MKQKTIDLNGRLTRSPAADGRRQGPEAPQADSVIPPAIDGPQEAQATDAHGLNYGVGRLGITGVQSAQCASQEHTAPAQAQPPHRECAVAQAETARKDDSHSAAGSAGPSALDDLLRGAMTDLPTAPTNAFPAAPAARDLPPLTPSGSFNHGPRNAFTPGSPRSGDGDQRPAGRTSKPAANSTPSPAGTSTFMQYVQSRRKLVTVCGVCLGIIVIGLAMRAFKGTPQPATATTNVPSQASPRPPSPGDDASGLPHKNDNESQGEPDAAAATLPIATGNEALRWASQWPPPNAPTDQPGDNPVPAADSPATASNPDATPGRSPVAQPPATAPASQPATAPAGAKFKFRDPPPGYRLSGIIRCPDGAYAQVNRRMVKVGGTVNGAKVVAVRDFSVEMELNDEHFILGIWAEPSYEDEDEEDGDSDSAELRDRESGDEARPSAPSKRDDRRDTGQASTRGAGEDSPPKKRPVRDR